MDLAKAKGASTWLTVLFLTEHGFALHNSAFHDALALQYGWTPSHLPSKCECGNTFNVEHALSCAKGGFPSLRHNEIQDITASLLIEVCNEMCVELQPMTSNQLMMPQPTVRMVQGWMCQPTKSGVIDFRRPFLM